MIDIGNIILNILVYLNLYGMYVTPTFALGLYYAIMRIFANPLATTNPHELVIIAAPSRVYVTKVTSRYLPFFTFKKGAYWFADPVSDGHNKYHVYIDGVNQPIPSVFGGIGGAPMVVFAVSGFFANSRRSDLRP